MSLDPSVAAQVASGKIARLDLIRFDLPGKTVGYHMGGRPYTYNGLVYLPNRWLSMGDMQGDLGIAVQTRELLFSDIPTDDPEDVINTLESYAYTNAPVIIAHLCGVPGTNTVLGVLASSVYEINQVSYSAGAMADDGQRTLTITVELEPPGRSARGVTGVKRSQTEQQFDNDTTDSGLRYVASNANWPEEWGQRRG